MLQVREFQVERYRLQQCGREAQFPSKWNLRALRRGRMQVSGINIA